MARSSPRAVVMRGRGLTPEQRAAYRQLQKLAVETLRDYPTTQVQLADAVGRHQSTIANILKGRLISVPTLEAILRALLIGGLRTDDRTRLREALARHLPILNHHPRRGRR